MIDVYAVTAERVPMIADQVRPPAGVSTFPAERMVDPEWMADRVADTGRRWGSTDARVNGTLWWYSASSTLTGIPVATALVTEYAALPRLEDASAFLRPDGYFGGMHGDTFLPVDEGVSHLAGELTDTLADLIRALAEASGVRDRALWAIVTDSVANRALDAGDARGDRALGSAFAERLVGEMRNLGAPMPSPRFVDVQAGSRTKKFTQRASCCLIYETRERKCTSCPKRRPSERLADLQKLV
ncbi:(2Fe-2S)-binding protein [Rhodococcus sp. NPDC058521]|uniref:(2Fe-2S)-binding protein n=1 Tax=Rhodococcus sp. NPDC058521 TaxID=3346536 RepID=UPI0036493B25